MNEWCEVFLVSLPKRSVLLGSIDCLQMNVFGLCIKLAVLALVFIAVAELQRHKDRASGRRRLGQRHLVMILIQAKRL